MKSVLVILLTLFVASCANKVSWSYPISDEGTLLYTTTNGAYHFVLYRTPDSDFLTASAVISGERLWTKKVSRQVDNALVKSAGEYLIVSCEKGNICVVESRTGEDKLVVSSPISVASGVKGLTFSDDILYYLCSDDEICAHRVGDNSRLWKSSPITGTLSFDFSLRQNRLLYGENSSRFVGLDTADGGLSWEIALSSDMETIVFLEEGFVIYYTSNRASFYGIESGDEQESYLVTDILGRDETTLYAKTIKDGESSFSACEKESTRWTIPLAEDDVARYRQSGAIASLISGKTLSIIEKESGEVEDSFTVDCDEIVDIKQVVAGSSWVGMKRDDDYVVVVIDAAGREVVSYQSEADYAEIFGEKEDKVYLKTIVFGENPSWLYKIYQKDGSLIKTEDILSYASVKKGNLWQLFEKVQLEDRWEIRSHLLE